MRLIDAEKVKVEEIIDEDGHLYSTFEINEEPTVNAIPIEWIKEQIEDCHYISGRRTDKVADKYNIRARHYEDLLSHWELFGKQWEREHNETD